MKDKDPVTILNLGCPKNQVDGETMAGLLAQAGYALTDRLEWAGTIIVNTCGFIEKARQESIDAILAAAEQKTKGRCRRLLVTGCLSQAYYQELKKALPEVDGFMGTGAVDKVVELVEGKGPLFPSPKSYDGLAETGRLPSTYPYGYLKIAEGCNHRCSYCVIPQLRGPLRSKDPAQVLAEANMLVAGGIKEIILVAQDTTQYGLDFARQSRLPELLTQLETVAGLSRVRLLYCYPEGITDELLQVMARSPIFCRYLDIPLQHSHPYILKSMGRRGGEGAEALLEKLRLHLPGLALRTSLIVGYPGEKPMHFRHLLAFVRRAKFDHLGAFVYSQEERTAAAKIEEQVPRRIKEWRYRQLMSVQQEIVFARNRQFIGQEFSVLIDAVSQGRAWGRSYREAPAVDSSIIFPAEGRRPGDFAAVRCTDYSGYDLLGEIDSGKPRE